MDLNLQDYDFVDFGCSKGGSIAYAQKTFKAKRGIGIDISETKVEATRAAGFEAILGDVRILSAHRNAVSFVTMLDFLEHLPGIKDAKTCIQSAADVARDFVFIRQPWFDSDGYLLSQNLKLYWSDWIGHPNAMTSLELHNILSRTRDVECFRIYGCGPVKGSEDLAIHSLSSPVDQHDFEQGKHPSKPIVDFDQPVFRQILCLATLKGSEMPLDTLEKMVPWSSLIYASDR